MFLYFSDWTSAQNISQMEKRGFPHADKLIKVFAANIDPSARLNRHITVVESSGKPFDQSYKYQGRGAWLSEELEGYLNHFHLSDEAKDKCRALFRFANSPQMEITQLAMSLAKDASGNYYYRHPLAIIDGLDEAKVRDRDYGFHLDIFTKRSIEGLKLFVDLENPQTLVAERESITLEKLNQEGSLPAKESR